MLKKTFLDNVQYGKNNWWRYLLTSFVSWFGPILLIIIILIPFMILSHPLDNGTDAENLLNTLDPMIILLFFGVYYVFSFLFFYFCTRLIHQKKLILFINTASNIKWGKILKGAGIWFVLMGFALIIGVMINPSAVRFSFNPSFFILAILSIIIYSIQATFEEVFFRGYLMQGIGLVTRKPVIPLLITSALFALGHFFNGSDAATGMGMVISMFIFGLTLGIITLGENSLETAIGVHIANNIFLTTVINSTGIFGDLPSLLSLGTGSSLIIPAFILLPLLLFIVFRGKWDKLELITRKTYKLDKIRDPTQIPCSNCKTKNPGFAIFCNECGEKIKVNYASTAQKTIAFLIDFLLISFIFGIVLVAIILTQTINNYGSVNEVILALIWIILDVIIFFIYFILLEKHGQTIGKIIMGIKVVRDSNHNPISYQQSLVRNLLLIVDLFPYPLPGLLAIIFSAKSSKKQRIGDLVAGTLVLKKK
ncbi:MAG TPA: RDD family protein [Methanobacterium sp.]|nr:RDD family protein [Methanobacterium sp.]HOI39257.1 RDD family protein [Methanobacterium sp.]